MKKLLLALLLPLVAQAQPINPIISGGTSTGGGGGGTATNIVMSGTGLASVVTNSPGNFTVRVLAADVGAVTASNAVQSTYAYYASNFANGNPLANALTNNDSRAVGFSGSSVTIDGGPAGTLKSGTGNLVLEAEEVSDRIVFGIGIGTGDGAGLTNVVASGIVANANATNFTLYSANGQAFLEIDNTGALIGNPTTGKPTLRSDAGNLYFGAESVNDLIVFETGIATGDGGGLTNLSSSISIAGSNVIIVTNTIAGTGVKTYTISSSGGAGSVIITNTTAAPGVVVGGSTSYGIGTNTTGLATTTITNTTAAIGVLVGGNGSYGVGTNVVGNGIGLTNLSNPAVVAGANITVTTNTVAGGNKTYTVAANPAGANLWVVTETPEIWTNLFGASWRRNGAFNDMRLGTNALTTILSDEVSYLRGGFFFDNGAEENVFYLGDVTGGTAPGDFKFRSGSVTNLDIYGTLIAAILSLNLMEFDGTTVDANKTYLATINPTGIRTNWLRDATGTNAFLADVTAATNGISVLQTNIISYPTTQPTSTNTLNLNNGMVILVTGTDGAITNLSGVVTGQEKWATLQISNSAAANITFRTLITPARAQGLATTNALVIGAAKVGYITMQVMGSTNYWTTSQQ